MRLSSVCRFCAGVSLSLLVAGLPRAFADSPLVISAESFDPAPSNVSRAIFSADGLHVAYTGALGSRTTVYVDGKPGEKYDEITNWAAPTGLPQVLFSPTGNHYAYLARTGQNRVVVLDGTEIPLAAEPYEVTEETFSPDGSHFAYAVNWQRGGGVIVLDGKEGPHSKQVKSLQFSADGNHFAYITTAAPGDVLNSKASVVLDGTPGQEFGQITALTFSPDGAHCGYIAQDAATPGAPGQIATPGKFHLIIDGKDAAPLYHIDSFQFSGDGQHVMYTGGTADPQNKDTEGRSAVDPVIGLDNQTWPYRPVTSGQPVISIDGRRIAYIEHSSADPASHTVVVSVNGLRGSEYDDIRQLQFSPDSQHMAYLALQSGGSSGNPNREFVVYDGNESEAYAVNSNLPKINLFFSPDGKHFAYDANDGTQCFVVADGKKGASYDQVVLPLIFSPDSQHLAYFAFTDTTKNMTPIERQQAANSLDFDPGLYLVADGSQSRLPPGTVSQTSVGPATLTRICFSPDSQHLAYIGRRQYKMKGPDGIARIHNDQILVVDAKMVKFDNPAALPNPFGDPALTQVQVQQARTAGMVVSFTPDNKHVLCALNPSANAGGCLAVDGNVIEGYTRNFSAFQLPPVNLPGNKIEFFAQTWTHQHPSQGPLQRLTVDLGPDRGFDLIDATIPDVPAAAQ
jgi:WD40 repeat protein